MPIYQEGQSKAKSWFSEENAFPSEEAAQAAREAEEADKLGPIFLKKPKKAWFQGENDVAEEDGLFSTSNEPTPEEIPEDASPVIESSTSEELPRESTDLGENGPVDVPEPVQESEVEKLKPKVKIASLPLQEEVEPPSIAQEIVLAPTAVRSISPSLSAQSDYQSRPRRLHIDMATASTDNAQPPSTMSTSYVENLRLKRDELKKQLEVAELEAEIDELAETLFLSRLGNAKRQNFQGLLSQMSRFLPPN